MADVSSRRRIGEILLASGAIDEDQLATALADQAGVAFAKPPLPTSDPTLLANLPLDIARTLQVLPLAEGVTGTVQVAVADPFDTHGQATVSTAMQAPLSLLVCPASALDAAIAQVYAAAEIISSSVIEALPADEDDSEDEELDIIAGDELVPDVDEDAEERIVDVAVTSSIPLGAGLGPLSTVPPGLMSLPSGAAAPPVPVVHSAPPDEDDMDDLPETAEETEPSDRTPEPPEEIDVDDALDLGAIEEPPPAPQKVVVPKLPTGPRAPLAPPPKPRKSAGPPAPPPPLAPLGPPPVATASHTQLSPIATSPGAPAPKSGLEEDTLVAIERPKDDGSAVGGLPPSLAPAGPPADVSLGDDTAPPPGLTTPLDLDGHSDRGLAAVVKELRGARTPETTLRLLAALLAHGLERQCDALRLTAEGSQLRVDYRVDGAMQLAVRLPAWSRIAALEAIHRAVGLPLAASGTEAVGRGFEATWKGRPVRCRIAAVSGGKEPHLVLRIRDSGAVRDLAGLGLPPDVRKRLRQWGAARQGVILVVGPADAGRSTTLRAIARAESKRRRTCVVGPWDLFTTDGQETYRYGDGPGEEDVAVAVHNALSRDPDVLVVDGVEGAVGTVLRAADDGRLVIAGVTGADAVDGIARLLEHVSEGLLGGQLLGVVEQRMGRGLCASCRSTAPVDKGLAKRLGLRMDTMPDRLPARGPGCRACRHAGTRGRYALFTRVEASGDLPAGSSKARGRLQVYVDKNRPVTLAEEGLGLVVQGKLSLHDLGLALGVEAPGQGVGKVVVTADAWSAGLEETMEGPVPTTSLDEESTEASGPRMLPDLLGESDQVSGEFLGKPVGQDPEDGRLLLVLGGDGLDDRLRKALPPGEFRVASVADVAAARDFIQRTAPRAILLSVAGDVPGSVAQVGVLREDLSSAFLPLLAVGVVGDDAHQLVRAGADETLAAGLSGADLEKQVREAMARAT